MEQDDIILVIFALVILGIGAYYLIPTSGGTTQHSQFAACLAEHNATMYGFDACSYCRRQKAEIGTQAFAQHIDANGLYVRCQPRQRANEPLGPIRSQRISSVVPVNASTTQLTACRDNVKGGTPTWVIDGKQYSGVQTLEQLAQATGCPTP